MSREENSAQQETNLQGEALLEADEREHLKCADLAARIADLEAKNEELEWKLNRIKKIRSGRQAVLPERLYTGR